MNHVINQARNSSEYKSGKFLNEYALSLYYLNQLVEAAKAFILDYHEEVTNWNDLRIEVQTMDDNLKVTSTFFAPVDEGTSYSLMLNTNEYEVREIKNVVVDPLTGELSLTINDINWNVVDDESIIDIAHYIEEQLKNTQNNY